MGIGKASVYKYIPDYFPKDVGAGGGIGGLLGRRSGVSQLAVLVRLGLTVWTC